MSQEHKEALARGRKEARAIKAYLEAMQARRPGRPVTKESLEKRLAAVNEQLDKIENPLEAVELIQKRLDIQESMSQLEDASNFEDLEAGFITHAKSYSERKDISYTAWREFGVPAATLRAAGIPETRRR